MEDPPRLWRTDQETILEISRAAWCLGEVIGFLGLGLLRLGFCTGLRRSRGYEGLNKVIATWDNQVPQTPLVAIRPTRSSTTQTTPPPAPSIPPVNSVTTQTAPQTLLDANPAPPARTYAEAATQATLSLKPHQPKARRERLQYPRRDHGDGNPRLRAQQVRQHPRREPHQQNPQPRAHRKDRFHQRQGL